MGNDYYIDLAVLFAKIHEMNMAKRELELVKKKGIRNTSDELYSLYEKRETVIEMCQLIGVKIETMVNCYKTFRRQWENKHCRKSITKQEKQMHQLRVFHVFRQIDRDIDKNNQCKFINFVRQWSAYDALFVVHQKIESRKRFYKLDKLRG